MTPRELREQREIGRGLDVERRDRHQTFERQRRRADSVDPRSNLADRAAALLLLFADVHLDVDCREALGLLSLLDQGFEQRRAVEGVDHAEQLDRFGRLVRLEPANSMEPDIRMLLQQCRPLRERFLHPAFAEVALACSDQRLDLLDAAPFGDGDELDAGGIAPGERRRLRNVVEDQLAPLRGGAHKFTNVTQSARKSANLREFRT